MARKGAFPVHGGGTAFWSPSKARETFSLLSGYPLACVRSDKRQGAILSAGGQR